MSRAEREALVKAALEAAAKWVDSECDGRGVFMLAACDPAAIADGVPETELCGSRGFAGPSGCIRQKGHAGEHKYGTIDFPINPVMVDQLVRQQEEIERLRARVEELETKPPWFADALNRRTEVEVELWNIYHGKRTLPTLEECREWAVKLGVPKEYQK